MTDQVKADILAKAKEAGFDRAGIASARLDPSYGEGLAAFLQKNFHGDMHWLKDRADKRASPDILWEEAQSVLMVGLNYGPETNPLAHLKDKNRANISVYALNLDYHDVIKKRLRPLASWIAEQFSANVKLFVDTAPLMEKPLAVKAGIGWQGKHTNLLTRTHGNWLFLGAIATDLDLPPDKPFENHCGQCQKCLDICPTGAITAPYQLDARRCISYLTIEHKGMIPRAFRRQMGNRVYGCDDCLAICPWNKFAVTCQQSEFQARQKPDQLADMLRLDETGFRARFRKSPVKRIGRARFLRNVLIACGNSQDQKLIPAIYSLMEDSSPLIRAAVIWALGELLSTQDFMKLYTEHAQQENDPLVQAEWTASLSQAASR